MEKTIYLPAYAKTQLETSDDATVWTLPLPFSEEPKPGFVAEAILGRGTLEIEEVLEDGCYYPDRDQSLIDTIESIIFVEKEIIETPKIVSPYAQPTHPNAKYRAFSGEDAECWARYDEGEIEVLEHNVFPLTGLLTGPSSYFLTQEKCIDRILAESAGIIINRKVLTLCDGSYDEFSPKDPRFSFTDEDKKSADKRTYKLFQDYDQGAKGWAIFTVMPRTKVRVIFEDHNCNVREAMLEETFFDNMGVDFKFLRRGNHSFYERDYVPTVADFEKDFHVNEDGDMFE